MFNGFTPEAIDFLWGIRMNNNREWFLEHKKDYVNHLYEPMKDLGKDLFASFLDLRVCIVFCFEFIAEDVGKHKHDS